MLKPWIISGNNDFIAPVEYVKKELLPYLRKGKLVTLAERGHWDLMTGDVVSQAFKHLVEMFFLKGIVEDSQFEYVPMNFTPAVTFQNLGKQQYIVDAITGEIKEKGIDAAVKKYHRLKGVFASYKPGEVEFLRVGYKLMGMKKYRGAIEIFKFNIRQYPGSVKGYNLLSYAYMKNGNKELAIKSCKKLLELDPENTEAMNRLKQLQSDTHKDEKGVVKEAKK